MLRLSLLTLSLVGVAGLAQAQSPASSVALDPNGRPFIGASDWHAGPGDYTPESAGPKPAGTAHDRIGGIHVGVTGAERHPGRPRRRDSP